VLAAPAGEEELPLVRRVVLELFGGEVALDQRIQLQQEALARPFG
jgi:hypothetical protein